MISQQSRLVAITRTVLIAGWLAAVGLPPVILLRARTEWLNDLGRPEVQEQWDAFRIDMQKQTGRDGTVQRKVPKSTEPPLRVWLRDYHWLAIAAWILFGTVLSFFTGLMVMGTVRQIVTPPFLAEVSREPERLRSDGDRPEKSPQ